MADFEKAIKKVLHHEGGYVWNKHDPGGETNLGITDRLDGKTDGLVDVDGDNSGDVAVKLLTEQQARIIYKRKFWDKMLGDQINDQQIAEILFDGFVNCGANGIKIMQRVLLVDDDGKLGPKTLEVLNRVNQEKLFNEYKFERELYYRELVAKHPQLSVFLKGWLSRIKSFKYA